MNGFGGAFQPISIPSLIVSLIKAFLILWYFHEHVMRIVGLEHLFWLALRSGPYHLTPLSIQATLSTMGISLSELVIMMVVARVSFLPVSM